MISVNVDKNIKNYIIKEICVRDACRCNGVWHSSLPKIEESNIVRNKYHVCYGAFCDGVCVAVAIWSSPVSRFFDQDSTLELRRMAISDIAPKNTASYMISKMIKHIKITFTQIKLLISYQDTTMHTGTIYKASNWCVGGYTKHKEWNKSRKRSKSQLSSDKIRWEYKL